MLAEICHQTNDLDVMLFVSLTSTTAQTPWLHSWSRDVAMAMGQGAGSFSSAILFGRGIGKGENFDGTERVTVDTTMALVVESRSGSIDAVAMVPDVVLKRLGEVRSAIRLSDKLGIECRCDLVYHY
jgi:hypothetical protein